MWTSGTGFCRLSLCCAWCAARLLLQEASKAAALVDTGLMSDAAESNGITSANLLAASKDEDVVF